MVLTILNKKRETKMANEGMPVPHWVNEAREQMFNGHSKLNYDNAKVEPKKLPVVENFSNLFAEYEVRDGDLLVHVFPRNGGEDRYWPPEIKEDGTRVEGRLEISWGRELPKVEGEKETGGAEPRPLLVLVANEKDTRDQRRFEDVVMKNESFLLAAKFFECVEVWDETARKHPLFEGVRFKAPAVVVFDSTRKEHAVAGGRASAMKIYGLLVKVGQADYETDIAATVRAARNLLGKFDQVDAAREALGIKMDRLDEARADGNRAKIRTLTRECEKDQKALDRLFTEATEEWNRIWTLKRKPREKPEAEDDEDESDPEKDAPKPKKQG